MSADSSPDSPSPGSSEERDSSVGLEFSVGIELRRRRGPITDVWEGRFTSVAIALIAALVIIYALVQIFTILKNLFSSG